MRATKAYIAGFGTTGLLLASALLTLSVMSAVVAFNGFPGRDVESPITPILVHERQAPVTIPTHHSRARPSHPAAAKHRRVGRAAAHQRARERSAPTDAPVGHSGPVRQRATSQAPATGTAPDSPQGVSLPANPVDTAPTQPPSLPSDTTLPPAPSLNLPTVPPQDTQLPVDTGSVDQLLP